MEFDAEAGYVVAGLDARADDRRATGIGGPMLGLGLGLTVNP